MSESRAAVVDTDVFSLLFVTRGTPDRRISRWRELLTGRRVLISFQTRAEALAGARLNRWGQRRQDQLLQILDRTPTIRSDDDVIDAYATLLAECRRLGHGLHDPKHGGDRWVAASALAKGLPLLSGDGIFDGAPGLSLLDADVDQSS